MTSSQKIAALVLAHTLLAVPASAQDKAHVTGSDAFSTPLDGMSVEERFDFHIGTGTFSQAWFQNPVETELNLTDGIGPLYNGYSCISCHQGAGRSHPVERIDMVLASRGFLPPTPTGVAYLSAVRLPDGTQASHPVFGLQVQDIAIDGFSPEARIAFSWIYEDITLADGTEVELRRPDHRLIDRIVPETEGEVFSQRTSPPLAGLGLLEALTDTQILSNADPEDLDGDGISGKARRLEDGSLGRFGWKAGASTLLERITIALSVDMGLSSEAWQDPYGDCVEDVGCDRDGLQPDIEASSFVPYAMADYVAGLAPAAPTPINQDLQDRGEALFHEARCHACHVPHWRTEHDTERAYLSGRAFSPYTDMLLHDMGPGLADRLSEGNAEGSEWRTAPLWGVGRTHEVEGFESFLHDGRARNLTEAILWHGGEGLFSRNRFSEFSKADRDALLDYLNSL